MKASFKAAWRGKATCASFALRFAPGLAYFPDICLPCLGLKSMIGVRIFLVLKCCSEDCGEDAVIEL